jgi:hypothetical protein
MRLVLILVAMLLPAAAEAQCPGGSYARPARLPHWSGPHLLPPGPPFYLPPAPAPGRYATPYEDLRVPPNSYYYDRPRVDRRWFPRWNWPHGRGR